LDDAVSEYIDSYYTRTLADDAAYPSLQDAIETDICVIGGGLAGLATALGLIERGRKVVLLEARRIGWGASGRNGGFCSSGYAAPHELVIKKCGASHARSLFDLTKNAQNLIRERITRFDIACDPVDGIVAASWYDDADAIKRRRDVLAQQCGDERVFWPREKTRSHYKTNRYYEALFAPADFHMHPLRYARGIGKAITDQGGIIFENSAVTSVENGGGMKCVHTDKGQIKANQIVYCGSAYFENKPERKLARACLPIATYVMVTEAIDPALLKTAIDASYAICDTRHADDYYRPLPDGRLLWGGRIGIGRDPQNLAAEMRRDMIKIYPQLRAVKSDMAWSGMMGYTAHRMPLIGCLEPGVWYCTNFGGKGVGPTTAGGEVIAKAIAEDDETYRLFEPFGLDYTGGVLGPFAAQALYYGWKFKDWWAEMKNGRL